MRAFRLGTLAVAALAAFTAPASLRADASGCTLYPNTTPTDDVMCGSPGPGCYLCEYSYLGEPGYTECAESPDGTIRKCKTGVKPQHQYSGSTVTTAPITPAREASGSHPAVFAIAPIEAPQAPR
jgi:hypothetical protein